MEFTFENDNCTYNVEGVNHDDLTVLISCTIKNGDFTELDDFIIDRNIGVTFTHLLFGKCTVDKSKCKKFKAMYYRAMFHSVAENVGDKC